MKKSEKTEHDEFTGNVENFMYLNKCWWVHASTFEEKKNEEKEWNQHDRTAGNFYCTIFELRVGINLKLAALINFLELLDKATVPAQSFHFHKLFLSQGSLHAFCSLTDALASFTCLFFKINFYLSANLRLFEWI